MKKTFCYLTVIAAFALAFVSCQKEESVNGPIFNGSGDAMVHPNSKTIFHPDDYTFTWKGSDHIHIWDAAGHHKQYRPTETGVTASAIAPSGTYNTLDESSSLYRAIYPDFYADTTSGTPTNISITLPVTQCMTNQVDDVNTIHLTRFPIYCETSNHTLYFKNLCGAIRLRLQMAGTSVERIAFSSTSDPVCGQFSIDWNDGDPVMTSAGVTSANNTVVLEYAQPININVENGVDFWISLPPAEYDNFQIKVSCINDDGTRCIRAFKNGSGHSLTIPRGTFIPMNPDLSRATTINGGRFSVSATQQVYFSPGNLQCVSNHWEFSPKQYEVSYDVIHSNGSNHYVFDPEVSYKWYLFGWSTTASDYGRSKTASNYTGQDYRNFGDVFTGRGVNSPWRLLTADEFGYLTGHSSCSTTRISEGKMSITVVSNGSSTTYTNFGSREIKVGDQMGLLLFPDVCTINLPSGVAMPASGTAGGTTNVYTQEQFTSIFEKAGCAFLPYAGYKDGNDNSNLPIPCDDLDGTTYSGAPKGQYWTSTYGSGTGKCKAMSFHGDGKYLNDCNRNSLYSVRLVTNYTPNNN